MCSSDLLRTADIKQEGDGCKLIGCVEMGQFVADLVTTMDVPVVATIMN